MPEAEFEMYLNVLSKLLRLNADQRSAIADELRDHLEARLSELTAAGHSREEAVRLALEDVGDATSLAGGLQQATAVRQRKRVVRYSLATVAALVAALFVTSAFWPVPRNLAPDAVVAQSQPEPLVDKNPAVQNESAKLQAATSSSPLTVSMLQQRLDAKVTVPVQFKATEFNKAIAVLQKSTGFDVWIDPVPEDECPMDFPVTLDLPASKFTLRMVLEVMVSQAPNRSLDYRLLGDLLMISNKAYVEVYDCRDLLAAFPEPAKQSVPFVHTPDAKPKGFGDGSRVVTLGGRKITEVIQRIVVTDSWSDNGGSGTIDEFNGLLSVSQTPRVHRELRGLLKLMRERLRERRELGAFPGNERAVSEVAEKERGCEPGVKAPLLCLNTPPSVDEVIRALPDDVARNNVRIVMEPIVDKLESCRVYPLVGPARLHKVHYKCTVYFDKVAPQGKPTPATRTDQGREVVDIDHDHLIRCANLTAGDK